jgi:hypothetical protein
VLPPPAGNFVFVDPRVAVDNRGRVHVVWGEPAPGTDVAGAPSVSALDVANLWHAMWSDGKWTTPTRIYEAAHIAWNRFRSSNLIADRKGGLDFSVPVQTADFEPSAVHLHFDSKSWSSHLIAAPATVIYTDIASLSNKRLALVFVAAGRGFRQGPTESELFVTTSNDDGASWAPLQIGEASQVPAYSPRLAVDDGGRLHMVWIQHAPRSTRTEALWHRSSDDGGRTWSAGARLLLAEQVREPSIVADACGTLHVAVQSQHPTGSNIMYARVANGGWTPLEEPFRESINRAPLLWRDSDARIHMLHYRAPVVPDWPSHYKLVLSDLEPAARRPGHNSR